MTIGQALTLGVIQGLTEFLPVSSSGHLVISQHYLGLSEPELLFTVFLHLGTVFAVFIVFWRDLSAVFSSLWNVFRFVLFSHRNNNSPPGRLLTRDNHFRLGLFIITGSLPSLVVGLLFHDLVEGWFARPDLVALFLIVTGLWLYVGERKRRKGLERINLKNSFFIGGAQAIAIIPGISRSGATITTGMMLGLKWESAVRYSFLLSIPAVIGASLLELVRMNGNSTTITLLPLFFGTIAAALVGILSIRVVLLLVRKRKLALFAYYCWAVGLTVLIWG